MRDAKYLQLLGSRDVLVSSLSNLTGPHDPGNFGGVYSGFRIYDNAYRNKTHAWIHGARHNAFNRRWVISGDTFEKSLSGAAGVLSDSTHETIAKCMFTAFFNNALLGWIPDEGYMEGTILPPSIRGLPIHIQHSRNPRTVVDNYGDIDIPEGLSEEALSKGTNSQGLTVDALGSGLNLWQDIEHITLSNSPHDTKGVELSWTAPDVTYLSLSSPVSLKGSDVCSLRIAQFFDDGMLNPVDVKLDAYVTLSDGSQEASVRLGAIAPIPYPDAASAVLSVLRTIRIRIDAFEAVNPSLSLTSIREVRVRLISRPTGHVHIDDIELGD